jgi:uncharacterized protein involved in exopolysaccharide biosynthesis
VLSTEYGLLDYGIQSREVTRGFLKTIDGTGSNNVNTKEILKLKENIEKMGGELIVLKRQIDGEASKYIELKKEYELAKMDIDRNFTYTNVITKPFVADKKAYPVRWLIVVVSALAAFFLTFLVILIIENRKGLLQNS